MRKQIVCLILATILLVGVIGCKQPPSKFLSGGVEFEVDGTKYWVYRHADVDRHERVVSSSLIVSLHGGRIGGSSEYSSRRGTTIVQIYDGGQKVVAKTDTLFFIQDEKIVFEKKYQELGIDAQRLNANLVEMRDDLFPILEKMIRENVQPQKSERE